MNNKKYLSLIFLSSCVIAQQSESQMSHAGDSDIAIKKELKSRTGYKSVDIGSGGRSSVTKQLYLDDIFVPDHLRFPEFDKSLQPYYEWKRGLRNKHGLQLGTDYTSLFQKASDSLTSNESAAGGVFRLYGRWLMFNKNKKNTGALVFKLENAHNYGTNSLQLLIDPAENRQQDHIGILGLRLRLTL